MMKAKIKSTRGFLASCGAFAALFLQGSLVSSPATAANFSLFDGAIEGQFDSIATLGAAWRTSDVASGLSGANNGGNFNFDKGALVSNRLTLTHDLGLRAKSWGALIRGSYFYDYANDKKDLDIPGISNEDPDARRDATLLDAYIYGDIGRLRWRLGRQVISWGESTFLQGSLNDINTFDLSKLRAPGSELKEALLPTGAALVQYSLTEAIQVEAFTLFEFDEIQLDPSGTFWNTNAAVARTGFRLGPLLRARDNKADASVGTQWGVSLRYFAPLFLQGAEFAAYRYRIHSHLPYISSISGGNYFIEYPEAIDIWGASFNTTLMPWAISGEWSHRDNAPIQLGGFIEAGLGAPSQLTPGGPAPAGTSVRGWDRVTVDQLQVTFQRSMIPRAIGAENGSIIAEVAAGHISDRPDLQTFTPITKYYGGYVVRASVDYNRAIAHVINLTPTIAFSHNVFGVSPEISPNFNADSMQVSVGVNWSYLLDWQGSIQYVNNFGGESQKNSLGGQVRGDRDRSWVSINVSYQF